MSQAQERRRAEAWETQHKESHEDSMKRLREMKARLDVLEAEYMELKAEYEKQFKAAEEFFLKYYE